MQLAARSVDQRLLRGRGCRFVLKGELLDFLARVFCKTRHERLLGTRDVGFECPVLAGLERLDLEFALHDHAQRRALHATGGQAGLHFAPQQRRQVEAHEVVERATRLLRVDEFIGQRPRLLDGVLHGLLGDLVEHDAVYGLGVEHATLAQQLVQVPRNGLALAVGVSREVQRVGLLERAHNRVDMFFVAVDDLVIHAVAVRRVNGPFFGDQVADVTIGRQHREILAQVFLDGLGLGRRFNDDEVL